MGLTLSHLSALDVWRMRRAGNKKLDEMTAVPLALPTPWVGDRWSKKDFADPSWKWMQPKAGNVLDVLTPASDSRLRVNHVRGHTISGPLPPGSVLWLDEHSSVVCPELLFVQMAEVWPLPALVMLGFELCGYFSRDWLEPLRGKVASLIAPVTSVENIADYIRNAGCIRGKARARTALNYVRDQAASVPEAVLAIMYGLPTKEAGYGMGPVTLNCRVEVGDQGEYQLGRARFPDLMFSFVPIGINYDGGDHLDLGGLVRTAQAAALAEGDDLDQAQKDLDDKRSAVRAKVVDDIKRNRQLAAEGKIVLPVTKEDLRSREKLDKLTWKILLCARNVFNVDTHEYERVLNNTDKERERDALLHSLMPYGTLMGSSHGHI